MLAGYALVLFCCQALRQDGLVYTWLPPVPFGQPFLRLYLLAEHGRCAHVANMFESTRTTFTTWLVRRMAWNMPFHAEHHTYPAVPLHRPPTLHRLAHENLKVTERGNTQFHRTYLADLQS